LLNHLPDISEAFALVDGQDASGAGGTWLLQRPLARIEAASADQLQQACEQADSLADKHHTLLLLDYELGYWLEPASCQSGTALDRPPFIAIAFAEATWLGQDEVNAALGAMVATLDPERRNAGIMNVVEGLDLQAYRHSIRDILDNIAAGNVYQVNFTWPLDFDYYGAPLALYYALRKRQAVRHGAFINLDDRTILSLSPELFVDCRAGHVIARPMKGTALRGATPEEDDARAAALQASVKDRAENVMIVDLLRNDLGRIARAGEVRVDALFEIERYKTLLQMVSQVSAEIGDVSLFDLLRALFPCGSITGAPKIRAMRLIQSLERQPRHLYTGSIGHWQPGGDFSLNVAIRTLELDAAGKCRLGIGSGIVADSDADLEYAECLAKANFVTALDPGFELIETILAVDGDLPYLDLHLDRLNASASAFGFHCDSKAIVKVLRETALHRQGQWRIRLTLAKDGTASITTARLEPLPPACHAVIAAERVDSGDLFLRHKTTRRDLYDAALAKVAAIPGCFDALFFNEKDELVEGARSSVFIVRDGAWYTPPLSAGALPGVMRRAILTGADHSVKEATLTRDDLVNADAVYLANALRGLVPCSLDATTQL
jgi:para-aminobenzoate synthetase/4-amino-4-deoxychorismate lyase